MPELSSKAVTVIVISAFATALGGLFTSRGVASCNPISLRFTSQCMSVLIGIVFTTLAMGTAGKFLLSDDIRPNTPFCSTKHGIMLATSSAAAFAVSGILYLYGLKLMQGDAATAASIMAPCVLVFTVIGSMMAGNTLSIKKMIGISLSVLAVLSLA